MAKFGEADQAAIVGATHAGVTIEQFLDIAKQWLERTRDPRWKRPDTELVYQPMLEVLEYLRASGFQTDIVSGGQEFIRTYAQRVYGFPLEQVTGSSIVTKYQLNDGKPCSCGCKGVLIDDHDGKPVGINLFIGKRPMAAFGNSDGDREMLEWTGTGVGVRLKMLVTTTMRRGSTPTAWRAGPSQPTPKSAPFPHR